MFVDATRGRGEMDMSKREPPPSGVVKLTLITPGVATLQVGQLSMRPSNLAGMAGMGSLDGRHGQ